MSARSQRREMTRRAQQGQRTQVTTTATFEARMVRAFPTPDELERYEALHPGFTERLLVNWEAQSRHRMELETIVIGGDVRRANLGLIAGFAIAIFLLGCGTFLIAIGRDVAGLATLATACVGLIGSLAYGTYQRNKRRGERQG